MVTAFALAYGANTKVKAYKHAKLFLEGSKAYEEAQRAHEAQIKYLCHMLEEHGVPVSEFDLIALNNYNQ
jgi:hypothetical protein